VRKPGVDLIPIEKRINMELFIDRMQEQDMGQETVRRGGIKWFASERFIVDVWKDVFIVDGKLLLHGI